MSRRRREVSEEHAHLDNDLGCGSVWALHLEEPRGRRACRRGYRGACRDIFLVCFAGSRSFCKGDQDRPSSVVATWAAGSRKCGTESCGKLAKCFLWRSDDEQAFLLGEAVAIKVLRDQRNCDRESFDGKPKLNGEVLAA